MSLKIKSYIEIRKVAVKKIFLLWQLWPWNSNFLRQDLENFACEISASAREYFQKFARGMVTVPVKISKIEILTGLKKLHGQNHYTLQAKSGQKTN